MSKEQIIKEMKKIEYVTTSVRVDVDLLKNLDSIVSEINKMKNAKTDRNKLIVLAIEKLVEVYQKN